MAGHSQFANIKHRKGAQDAKRAKLFTKIIREITTAAKLGMSDVSLNPRLNIAVSKAKILNVPKDKIEDAINRANNKTIDNVQDIRYNASFPNGIFMIIECATDNNNRTFSDVRTAVTKFNGKICEPGSIEYLFEEVGLIVLEKISISEDTLLNNLQDFNIVDIIQNETEWILKTKPTDFHSILNFFNIKIKNLQSEKSYITWLPHSFLTVNENTINEFMQIKENIEEIDDVQNVYLNIF